MTGALNHGVFNWSDEAVTRLKAMRLGRESSSTIASALSREFGTPLSRSAVIGKLHRLGIKYEAAQRKQAIASGGRSGRQIQSMRQAKDRANQARIAHPLKVVHMRLFSNTDDIAISPRTISDPLFGGCRWPTDLTAPNGEAMFCCNGRGSLRPYCEPHMVRAFQATRPADVKTHEAALLAQRRAQAAAEGRQGFSYARAAS